MIKEAGYKGQTIYKDEFNNLVNKEANRMLRVMRSLSFVGIINPAPYFDLIDRRARISVYGRLVADGATLEGV